MKIKEFFAVSLCALGLVLAPGCISTPDGHHTAGMPFVKDSKTSRYSRPVDEVVAATVAVLKFQGQLLVNNTVNNTFQAKVNERDVWVKVTKVDNKTTEVYVLVRGRFGGDVDLAAEIDKQIALHLVQVQP